jgi:lipoprotein-releasing system permease protein
MWLRSYTTLAIKLAFSHVSNNLWGLIIIIALSLVPLMVTWEVMDGMTLGVVGRYVETSSYHFRVQRFAGQKASWQELQEVKQHLSVLPSVSVATIENEFFAMAFGTNGRQGVLIRGVEPLFYQKDKGMQKFLQVQAGQLDLHSGGIAIGSGLARKLALDVGQSLRILSVPSGQSLAKIVSLPIVAIVSTGYDQLDEGWIFIDIEQQRLLWGDDQQYPYVSVKVDDPFTNIQNTKQALTLAIPQVWFVQDWMSMNYAMLENFRTTKIMMMVVLGLIVLVAVFNISSSLYLFFLGRRYEFALLKSMGMPSWHMSILFVFLGLVASLCGIGLGFTLGAILSLNVNYFIAFFQYLGQWWQIAAADATQESSHYYLSHIVIHLHWTTMLITGISVLLLAFLASLWPALHIAKQKALTILRKV